MGPKRSDAEKEEHQPGWDRHTDRPSTARCVNDTHESERLLNRYRTRYQHSTPAKVVPLAHFGTRR
jgi:hypothetical protein